MMTPELEQTLQLALTYAGERAHEFATLEHLLLAMTDDRDVDDYLKRMHVPVDKLAADIAAFLDKDLAYLKQTNGEREPKPTIAMQRVFQRAALQVQSSGRDTVTSLHVLIAMFAEPDSYAVYFMQKYGLTRLSAMDYLARSAPVSGVDPDYPEDEEDLGPALDEFCVNLNEKAKAGKIDPLIGRDAELHRIMQVLCRRSKNNPLLIGDPGVGKTALAEGLALKIVKGDVPEQLKTAEIYQLDMGELLAGTRYRGDFEARVKDILDELEEQPNVLLFIDEIHNVIGAGATSGGTMDASNLLKPALSSGSMRCIGSTTYKEYRNHLEKDRAFLRRFQKIDIKEPTPDETIKILKGLKPSYEKHHGVVYTADALKASVDCAVRYIFDRKLPDKAIDLLDEAGAANELLPKKKRHKQITAKEIEAVVSTIANVPVKTVSSDDRDALRTLEQDLKKAVFGQNKALEALASSIKMARAGLRDAGKPVGCYLFSGPTGVGKTEAARQLAKTLGVELLRFDMSEYMEKHSVSRLIGTPPGYVGFEQGGLLTDAVDQHPYSVLLLDEVEKAHPDLFNILLQVMDYGKMTDSNGKQIDFSNVILIMTTNAGAADMQKPVMGFGTAPRSGEDKEAIEKFFTPEFRNRLDAIIPFARLDGEIMRRVADKFVKQLAQKLAERRISLELAYSAKEWLVKKGFDDKNGARPLARLIQEEIKKPLADEILFGKLVKGGKVRITARDGKLQILCTPAEHPSGKSPVEEDLMLL